eukprot:8096988-Lingulodinium_polyedra.AAC.1
MEAARRERPILLKSQVRTRGVAPAFAGALHHEPVLQIGELTVEHGRVSARGVVRAASEHG